MKLIRIIFLISLLAILVISSSSLLLNPYYSSPIKQDDKIIVKALHRKLMIILDEHANVMTSTHYEGSSQEVEVTSSGKAANYEKEEKLKREEEKTLSKYLSMDYPKFRRRRPVHNKSLPRSTLTP